MGLQVDLPMVTATRQVGHLHSDPPMVNDLTVTVIHLADLLMVSAHLMDIHLLDLPLHLHLRDLLMAMVTRLVDQLVLLDPQLKDLERHLQVKGHLHPKKATPEIDHQFRSLFPIKSSPSDQHLVLRLLLLLPQHLVEDRLNHQVNSIQVVKRDTRVVGPQDQLFLRVMDKLPLQTIPGVDQLKHHQMEVTQVTYKISGKIS